jgi:hypothetical protein
VADVSIYGIDHGVTRYRSKDDEAEAGWVSLAELDESQDYETDVTEILYDAGTRELILATASGCSCWDGEWFIERYPNLKSLEQRLLGNGQGYQYNPSLKGAEGILQEAKEALKSKKLKLKR